MGSKTGVPGPVKRAVDYEPSARTDIVDPSPKPPLLGALLRGPPDKAFPSEFRLSSGICRVGSEEGNDIVLRDRSVSRTHAEITLSPHGVVVADLASTNGTTYLGQRFGTMVLNLGARICLGNVPLAIEPDVEGLYDELEYEASEYRGILGCSSRMRQLFAVLARLEPSLVPVLVEGESGVGKERVASAIHAGSPVHEGPFVAINCGAVSKELVASELFGHKRGAYTGASETRRGAFDRAHGGTLFLDEIGELPLDVQPLLLRALELGEFRPVGSDETRHVKIRLIAATNRDLEREVEAGTFRRDLFFRLAVVRIHVPPLRGRPDDIELLAAHFAGASGIATLPTSVMEEIKARPWTGNVRELRNALEAYAALGRLPPELVARSVGTGVALEDKVDPLRPFLEQKEELLNEFTRLYVRGLLKHTNGNQAAAARIAKMDRTYFGRLVAKFGAGHWRPLE